MFMSIHLQFKRLQPAYLQKKSHAGTSLGKYELVLFNYILLY